MLRTKTRKFSEDEIKAKFSKFEVEDVKKRSGAVKGEEKRDR